ncbi:MAG TPA: chromate resistance protein ChrB domain-containing protein [Pyrinomonadaceae bacterium]|nr:chromate resistance protein ChrB domain-containing protein [Pyrinomonadaceae bacterium]
MSSFIERQKVGGRDSYMPHKHIPLRLIIFLLSSLSIISLLLYFLGVGSFVTLALVLFLIEAIAFIGILVVARGVGEARRLLTLGLWAGALATLAYDVVRIPVAHSGIPVFKAISYFGTVLLGVQAPTPLSETLGWAYHLSNGVSFGLMYAALVSKPRIYSAIIWGLTLEAVMLMTPYAEVFGYRRDAKFFVITIGAHAVYGAVLYLGLQLWQGTAAFSLKPSHVALGLLLVPVGISLIALDSYRRYSRSLPPSPPAYIGPHLYTTWDVPEPDRIVAMWMTRRFVDPKATFYFIKPFERIRYGQPFDIPEAEIRRHGIESATQFLVARQGLSSDKKLDAFARMTYLNEITPWMLASDPQAGQLTQQLRLAAEQHCGEALRPECTESLFKTLDALYEVP